MTDCRPLVLTLTVQEGDTVEGLARSIGVDKQLLIDANGGIQFGIQSPVQSLHNIWEELEGCFKEESTIQQRQGRQVTQRDSETLHPLCRE